jgi:predicted PurR-regulated permease PerM
MTRDPESAQGGAAALAPADPVAPQTSPKEVAAEAAVAAARIADAAATEAAVAADAAEALGVPSAPLPLRARTRTLLGVLVLIAVLFTCYLARELIVPVLLAVFLGLAGNPIVSRLRRWYVPRFVGALAVVSGGLAALIVGGSLLLPSAAAWMRQAPNELRHHMPTLRELTKPFEEATKATASLQQMTEVGPPAPSTAPVRVIEAQRTSLLALLSDAPRAMASVLAVLILSFFFMVYGEDLLRRFVTVVPGWRQKRVTVDILRSIQSDISRYMLTISAINAVLAAAVAAVLMWIGFAPQDALLWGVVAGVLNFAPYIGPMFTAIALVLVGMVEFDNLSQAMLPAAAFLGLHLVEGQFITPMVLGRSMAISPVILMLWLFLWGWMWGIAGLLLAVPMLVCAKIYCSRIDALKSWALMMEP